MYLVLQITKLRLNMQAHIEIVEAEIIHRLRVHGLLWLCLLIYRLIPMLLWEHRLFVGLKLIFWNIKTLLNWGKTPSAMSTSFAVKTAYSCSDRYFTIKTDALGSASCSITCVRSLLSFSHKWVWPTRTPLTTTGLFIVMVVSSLCYTIGETSLNVFWALTSSLILVVASFSWTILFYHFLPLLRQLLLFLPKFIELAFQNVREFVKKPSHAISGSLVSKIEGSIE